MGLSMKDFKKLIIFSALTAISASSYAQSKFEGVYGQVGIGYEEVNPKFSASGSVGSTSWNIPTSADKVGSFTGSIGFGFYLPISQGFLLGFGAEYSPVAGKKANYSTSTFGVTAAGQYNKESSYNLFISPATPVGQDGLLYGKVGYTVATVKDAIAGDSSTTNFSGYSLGLGYKQIIQGGLYGFLELNYMAYRDRTNWYSGTAGSIAYSYSNTSTANALNGLVGVGYKF
jgi:outer membrane immunogenic protein